MTERAAADYLGHILRAGREAVEFCDGMTFEAFREDRRTQQAVVMSLIVMGEAVVQLQRVDADFLERHPALPWRAMRGVRNHLVHGYFDINLDLVWMTVTRDLPPVIAGVEALVGGSIGPLAPE
jgi:uncharacterized protein with HEPN domain